MAVTARTLITYIAAIVLGISGDSYSAANIETDTAGSKKLQVSRTLLEEAPDVFRNQFLPRLPGTPQLCCGFIRLNTFLSHHQRKMAEALRLLPYESL